MEKLHEVFIAELQDLLKRYEADISLRIDVYDQ